MTWLDKGTAAEGSDLKALLTLALQGFVRAIAEPDHPLTLRCSSKQPSLRRSPVAMGERRSGLH